MVHFSKLLAAAVLTGSVIAHPGEHHDHEQIKREIVARNNLASAAKRSLDSCSSSVKSREVASRSAARRAQVAQKLREKRGITTKARKYRRDLATLEIYEAINHNETGLVDYTSATSESTIFSANTSCILTPEITSGPYYVTGEAIRKDVTEGQAGIPLYLEIQYLDITTCEPVPEVYVDIWNCNATGVYSGVIATGNDAGWDTTFLRGIQATDSDGVASFETLFPGHYSGRATHTHLLSHSNVTVLANGTIQGGSVSHIGQLFWNEELRSAAEATYPYSANTQPITSNADDAWSIGEADNDYDPFPEFMYLSDDITDGLLAWIQIGINTTVDQSTSSNYAVAAVYQEDGGHQSTSSSMGGGFAGGNTTGAPGGNMTGLPPSGNFTGDFNTSASVNVTGSSNTTNGTNYVTVSQAAANYFSTFCGLISPFVIALLVLVF